MNKYFNVFLGLGATFVVSGQVAAATWSFEPIVESGAGTVDIYHSGGANFVSVVKDFSGGGSLGFNIHATRSGDETESTLIVYEKVLNNAGAGWDGFVIDLDGALCDEISCAGITGAGVDTHSGGQEFATIHNTDGFNLVFTDGGVDHGQWFNPHYELTIDWEVVGVSGLSLDVTQAPNPVPLPAAAWLFGSAMIGLVGFSRKKARVAAA